MAYQYDSRFIKINPEIKQKIAALWEEGKTGSEIGNELGLTRNSVIGAVFRMRKQGLIASTHEENKKNFNKKEKKPEEKQIVVKTKPTRIDPPKAINRNGIKMSELKLMSCRYIIQEGDYNTTKYCGAKVDKCSYCKEHYRLCYYPARTTLEKLVKI